MSEKNIEISELSFEQARDELAQVVNKLESGRVELEQALQLWERGEELAQHCEQKLTYATARLTQQAAESKNLDTQAGAGQADG